MLIFYLCFSIDFSTQKSLFFFKKKLKHVFKEASIIAQSMNHSQRSDKKF